MGERCDRLVSAAERNTVTVAFFPAIKFPNQCISKPVNPFLILWIINGIMLFARIQGKVEIFFRSRLTVPDVFICFRYNELIGEVGMETVFSVQI